MATNVTIRYIDSEGNPDIIQLKHLAALRDHGGINGSKVYKITVCGSGFVSRINSCFSGIRGVAHPKRVVDAVTWHGDDAKFIYGNREYI
jgi:hypothetical protein